MRVTSAMSDQRNLRATACIIMYQDVSAGSAQGVAMIHNVLRDENGRPVAGSGDPLPKKAMIAALQSLTSVSEHYTPAFLPENMLAHDPRVMAWWTPVQRRPIFFRTGTAIDKRLDGRHVTHPALMFIARPPVGGIDQLRVYALIDNCRPVPESRLYRAPYFNLYDSGLMCSGTAKLPDSPHVSNLAEWESAFFETSFVHTNAKAGSTLTEHEGGHNQLWLDALKAPGDVFPGQWLAPQMVPAGARQMTAAEAIAQ
jgi:PRTRC genetic system protein B